MRWGRVGLLVALTVFVGACTPWVKPYERAHLADEIMSFDRDPIANGYLHHVYEAREAARGADGASGGGCGCN
ncbi:DUF4266 domain-containing protein [Gilvimarinus agarilyticus]|uniref:DUF4266 domain-containing protein n=1 Tax=unclassified Gilvimarinus TaxID=2642066 RepID=UPI001C09561B|nr:MULTISPECIES: DUF4266 domain-containing protein [unclassified Gilvimarinus]MBU2886300.1 DUF4266 domain-containing protein [Gilvimarinus agarilyticus]MDO6570986.1 DUF4266 domain-containing protein [Gilvimarinus sp. 2_MG-2023]MDO6747841.1 DUF4266 domain-containing protein [Gilvimarinus sp. 1_MG-2023]